MLCSVAVWGAAFAGFALASSLWLTLTLLAVAGAADMFTVVFRGTIVQQTTPDALRGRVTAADYVVGAGGSQLGNVEAGALGSLTSPVISALSGGLATIAGAVLIGLALPAFSRYRAESPAGRRSRLARTPRRPPSLQRRRPPRVPQDALDVRRPVAGALDRLAAWPGRRQLGHVARVHLAKHGVQIDSVAVRGAARDVHDVGEGISYPGKVAAVLGRLVLPVLLG